MEAYKNAKKRERKSCVIMLNRCARIVKDHVKCINGEGQRCIVKDGDKLTWKIIS